MMPSMMHFQEDQIQEEEIAKAQKPISNNFLFIRFWWQEGNE